MRTKAIRQDDGGFRISGQKVWTTNGQWADYGYLLARTCPEAPKHKGISAFIIDMRSPGVDVRPLREMTGTADFNEVFLDDVLVSADALIGTVDDGWRIANSSPVTSGPVSPPTLFACNAISKRCTSLPGPYDAETDSPLMTTRSAIGSVSSPRRWMRCRRWCMRR